MHVYRPEYMNALYQIDTTLLGEIYFIYYFT